MPFHSCRLPVSHRNAAAAGGSHQACAVKHFLTQTLIFALVALFGVTLVAGAAAAGPYLMKKSDVRSGTLLFKAVEEGRYVQAPLVGADYDISISAATGRTRVTQHFINPTDGWVEGVYVFPLPENAAVDTLKMVVGNRVIIGEVKEKKQARIIYETAKREGKKATLMEQERPNVFTNAVANIGPRETILIQIEYQQTVPQSNGQFSLRVPLVVAPRYNPAPVVQTVDLNGTGWAPPTDPVPSKARIESPVLDPRNHPPANPVTLTVRLKAGFPLGEVKSHHHQVKLEGDGDSRIITLDGVLPADKDFELTWKAKAGASPAAGLFRERVGSSDYLLALVTPPALETAGRPRAREIIFVIDNSGSMGGTSIGQAKASLLFGLDHLAPGDSFNIVRFDNTFEVLFPAAVPADGENLARAKAFVSGLQANGGTEMVPALRAALADTAVEANTLRQVVFLTDGAIGNEQQLFDALVAGLGRSRVFMVGIGSAPNSYLMTHAAELGRGTFTHIGSASQVKERMRELFAKLERPAVTDISVTFSGGAADVTPKLIPDLYAGETLQIAAKLARLDGTVEIKGMIGTRPWVAKLPVVQAAESRGLSKVWARAKVNDAEVASRLGHISSAEADKRILRLALEHGLLSRLTSLVAVDKTPSRPANAPLSRADVPLNLPAGWDFDKVFGKRAPAQDTGRSGTGADGEAKLIDASAPGAGQYKQYLHAIAASSHRPRVAAVRAVQTKPGVALPQTATNAQAHLLGGALLFLLGLGLAAFAWRRGLLRLR